MPVMSLTPPRDWPTLGPVALQWMEHYLCHGPGDVQGQSLFINEEAAQFIYDAYRLYPKGHDRAGRRVVSYAGLSEPKGFAKSELAGAVVCFELRGPCRFDGWDAKGEPVGKQITYPFIRPLATEEGQTGNTYGNVFVMLEHARDKFAGEWGFNELDIGATRTYVGRNGKNGEVRPSTAGAASKDGGKESFAVADEPHLYILPETRSMHAMVRRNCTKRRAAQPWMMATTTMFEPGQGSVAEDLYDEADKQAHAKRRIYSFLWHHREGFDVKDEDKDNDGLVLASLAEAYAPVLDHMDPELILENEVRAAGSVWAENVRYFLNRKHQGEAKAVDPVKWDALADPTRTPGPSRAVDILEGFDGAEGGSSPYPDDTVLIGWTVEERPHLFLVDYWAKPEGHKGPWRIPRRDVRKRVTEVRESYNVRRLVADPPGWRDELTDWEAEHGDDDAGDPIVIEFATNQDTKMDPAIDRFLEAIDQGNFTHDGDPRLRYYVLNAVLIRASGRSRRRRLVKEKQTAKIDGCIAAVIGYDELQHLPVVKRKPVFAY